MKIERGDVLKARFPHASGGRGKKRPVVVVQANSYNQRLRHAVVAQVSTNLDMKDDPAYLFIDAAQHGRGTGLDRDCLICGPLL
ncbi:MAG TPA: type II toxin-antitoxin system PemK/MazF family toxin [Gemmataceae bacterium]|jgi:mRNA-degrading endonuclease toxin of MazEF toxin-antitoxin module|nr:type II toxin-antitoxin system PemK/MazF family toxin [Gemmataceae bacterium]